MDLELNTLHLMTRYTPPASVEKVSQYRDYKAYKKRIRKSTRDLLDGKGDAPEHVMSSFREYVESLVRVYELEDAHRACQSEYAGLPPPGQDEGNDATVPGESSLAATARLLSAPVSPEAAVKQGLGVITHKKKVALPEKRRRRKNKSGN